MMGMMLYVMIYGFSMLWMNYSFWLNVGSVGLFFVLSLFVSPIYIGAQMAGYDLLFDTLSFSLWVLSVWLIILMTTSSFSISSEKNMSEYFMFLLFIMLLMLMLTFSSANYLALYIFFEASLIPTLLVIMGWGYQTERLQAGVYFLFYTITSSLPLLLVILWTYSNSGTLMITSEVMEVGEISWGHMLVLLSFISAFLVSMPMFFVHLWLPSAHVEAPVAGSMILAGVLLKLGGYGLCRVMMSGYGVLVKFGDLMVSVGLVSMLIVGFICCRLNDMKALVAYSSVAHMGLVIAGLYVGGVLGFGGSLIMMIGHGLASSGLFSILNMYYERTGSRSFYVNSGMILVVPTLSFSMFMLCASNMGAPPSVNLLAELYLLGSLMGYSFVIMWLFPLGSFLGVVFTIFLFSHSQHGKLSFSMLGNWNLQLVEFKSLLLHVIPLNVMVTKFEVFLLWL